MAFGSIDKSKTPYERSIADMQNRKPILQGPNKDTYITEDNRHFFMNRQVSKEEYDRALDLYNQGLDDELKVKNDQLN